VTQKTLKKPKFTFFQVPEDPKYREALGLVAIRHAHLDRILQMTIKTLADVTPDEALHATAFEGSSTLRGRILKLGKQRLGEGRALIRLQALVQRCATLTDRRNEYMHSICARELDGKAMLIGHQKSVPLPKAAEIEKLASDLAKVTMELNEARLEGFIHEALARHRSRAE
jgi:hypothetical protein